jgi:hypothetical protein
VYRNTQIIRPAKSDLNRDIHDYNQRSQPTLLHRSKFIAEPHGSRTLAFPITDDAERIMLPLISTYRINWKRKVSSGHEAPFLTFRGDSRPLILLEDQYRQKYLFPEFHIV